MPVRYYCDYDIHFSIMKENGSRVKIENMRRKCGFFFFFFWSYDTVSY